MPYELGIDAGNDCIVVTHRGEISLAESRAAQAAVLALAVERGVSRVLIDVTGITNDFSAVEIFVVSSGLERPELPRLRGALLARSDQEPKARLLETVASNRGLDIRSFTERAEALAWLSTG